MEVFGRSCCFSLLLDQGEKIVAQEVIEDVIEVC